MEQNTECHFMLVIPQCYIELLRNYTVNIICYVTYFSTSRYSGNRFRPTLVTFRPSLTINRKVRVVSGK